MARCRPTCDVEIAGTNREKWDYVRGLYYPMSALAETRAPNDLARIAEEAAEDVLFSSDEATWQSRYSSVPFERWLQWKYEYGTQDYGNLPRLKAIEDVGHCHAPCPYSTESTDLRSEHMLGAVPTGALTKVTHTVGGVTNYMITAYSGKWGFRCVYDGCPYYLVYGERYLYV